MDDLNIFDRMERWRRDGEESPDLFDESDVDGDITYSPEDDENASSDEDENDDEEAVRSNEDDNVTQEEEEEENPWIPLDYFPANYVSRENYEHIDSVGPHHDLTFQDKPADFFGLFFTEEIFQRITDQTNLYARQKQEAKGKEDKFWRPVDVKDIKVFIAIQIIMGIHQLPEYVMYWSDDDRLRVPGVADVMGRNRYVHSFS